MKSIWAPLTAILSMTYFYRAREGHGPLSPPPPDLLLYIDVYLLCIVKNFLQLILLSHGKFFLDDW